MSEFQVIEPGSISEWVWDNKYRYKRPDGTPIDMSVQDTFSRVAHAVARAETGDIRIDWVEKFYDILRDFEFLPAGRILAGAGTGRNVTMFNCYVSGTIEDSLIGIMRACTDAALTLKTGGGIGMDFSTLRYRGAPVKGVDSESSGAVSFMDVWNSMCGIILSAGARRGAMMGTLRCDHPDIEEFISAKRKGGKLTNFNVSVLVTDQFMTAVRNGSPWDLKFGGEVIRTLKSARLIWDDILRATYECADPGVIFIDRVNDKNPLRAIETIAATNPCGEQPLPPHGACLLGSINLTRFIRDPFTPNAKFDYVRLAQVVPVAVRFLDNVVDVSRYPLVEQLREAGNKRRIGLGVTGFADALAMLGIQYQKGAEAARAILSSIETWAIEASEELAKEKGAFPLWNESLGFKHRRNSHLTSIAPTGTISLLAGNVSSGIEPIFDLCYMRKILLPDGTKKEVQVNDYAFRLWDALNAPAHDESRNLWQTSACLTPSEHLAIVAACQPHVDSAISKTINCPESITFEDFSSVYDEAYKLGLKGCTTFRPNEITGSVLSSSEDKDKGPEDAAEAPCAGVAGSTINAPALRPRQLPGVTYKIKPGEHALYVTICDIETFEGRRPFEIFFNSKQIDGYDWMVALSRMISAIFRKGGDVEFVIEELQSVFSPRGGFFSEKKYQPSICAAIGDILHEHMLDIGFLRTAREAPTPAAIKVAHSLGAAAVTGYYCPKCQVGVLHKREGCMTCGSCDYSKC